MSMILTVILDPDRHRGILALERGGHDMKDDVVPTREGHDGPAARARDLRGQPI